jgi:hypothetical protein
VFLSQDAEAPTDEIEAQRFRDDIVGWLSSDSGQPLFLAGVERLEIYELPERGTADG